LTVNRALSALGAWALVVLWLGFIALESSHGSPQNTGGLLREILWRLFGRIDWALFDLMHHILRKTGHAVGFGVLGLLLWRAFRRTLLGAPPLASAALAIAGVFVAGALDEWHQSFSSLREASFRDVMLDTGGALVFVSVALMLASRRPARLRDS
jgi:VanZ family protein